MEGIEWHVTALDSTQSTNSYLDAMDRDTPQPEGCVVTARAQLAGRGQRGNSWEAAPGENLTFSYLLRPAGIAPQEQFVLSQAVSLAVVDVLSQYAEGFSVKWPNDIYYHDSKIAGILIEHTLSEGKIGRTIVGIGLNVNQLSFLSDAPNPISLREITGMQYDLDELLQRLLEATSRRYAMCLMSRDELQSDYMSVLYRREGVYWYRDKEGLFEASIERVCPDGMLLLRDVGGAERRYAFKEVAFIL